MITWRVIKYQEGDMTLDARNNPKNNEFNLIKGKFKLETKIDFQLVKGSVMGNSLLNEVVVPNSVGLFSF